MCNYSSTYVLNQDTDRALFAYLILNSIIILDLYYPPYTRVIDRHHV